MPVFRFIFLFSFVTITALAQTTLGTILGETTDSSGALLPDAAVVVRNMATGIEHHATTGANGLYQATNLPPGRYSISVSRTGFRTHVISDVILETSATVRADAVLAVGELATQVTVEASAPLINTEGAEVANVRSAKIILEAPVNYRGDSTSGYYASMLHLTPGAQRAQGSNFSLAGARGRQYGTTVDGTKIESFSAQGAMDSTAEMRVQLANDKAEALRPGGMYASSKSGGNDLHGAVFYYLGSSRLRARSPFSLTVPFRDDDDYGAAVGGPIIKNRTFFHSMYERFPMRMETVLNTSVPTMRMREGDFSALLPGRVIRDPLNGQPFADNVIPQNRLNPVSLKVQERFYPPPNSGTPGSYQSNFRDTLPSTWFKTQIETRIDHKLTNENSMFGRVMWNRGGWESQSEAVPTFPYTRGVRSTTVVTISDTHICTPSLINEFRFGTLRIQYPYFNPLNGADLIREFGLEGLSPDVTIQTGAPRFNVTGFASLGAATMVSNDRERHVQFSDNVTWIRGVHTVKAGFDIRHNTRANFVGGGSFVQRAFGTFGFTGVYSNFPYADFLLGIPQTSNRTNPAEQMYHLSNTDVAGFIQDDWKVTRRLTLNIGLRWDFNPPYHERNGLSFHFDPTSGRVVVPREESKRHVNPLFPANLAPIVTARDAGLPDNLFYSYKKHFMPRFGFAFRPFADSRTVIRGGYGMYTDQITDAAWNNIVGGPYISDETFTNAIVGGKPDFMFPLAFPDGFGATGVQNFTANDPHLRSPVIQQWNVTVERELFDMGVRVSYIGTNSRHLIWTANLNQPTPGMEPFRNDMRKFPAFRTVALRQNGGNHDYHSLHVVAERKMKNGLYYQFGWTWAKALTDVLSDGEPGSTPENSYARRMERANADYIPRHRTVTNLNYELPFGPGKPWLSAIRGVPKFILGGWSLTAMLMTDTGLYFNPVFSGYDVSSTNTIGGRPDRIADGNLPKAKRSVSMWFDPAAFRVPGDLDGDHRPDVAVGRFGNSSPNVLQGHGLFHLNAGLFKRFFISERVTAVLQGTFDNALNHPGWGIPSNNISVPGEVGQIRSLRARGGGGPRNGMVALRIEF